MSLKFPRNRIAALIASLITALIASLIASLIACSGQPQRIDYHSHQRHTTATVDSKHSTALASIRDAIALIHGKTRLQRPLSRTVKTTLENAL